MITYIPTRGRWRSADVYSGTLKYLETAVKRTVVVVTHPSEKKQYEDAIGSTIGEVMSVEYDTIDQKRLLIGKDAKRRGEKKFLMLDDDLGFLTRTSVDAKNQRMSVSAEVTEAIKWIDRCLDDYASVGLSAREANGLSDCVIGSMPAIKECYRLMRAVAFRTKDFLSVEHCRVQCMEDHDVQLQLLRSGRKNAALYWWAAGQKSTNTRGGCSTWRTLEVHNASARRLAELHPGLVSLRTKQNKGEEGGLGTRVECTIQWQRAFDYNRKKK